MILGGYIDFPHALRRIYFQFYQYVALIFSEFGMPKHQQLEKVKGIHDEDLSQGYGEVYLPDSLIRKYPHASKEFRRQYIFPSRKRAVDPHTGIERRSHVLESGLQKAVKIAVDRDGITKRVGCQTFRHSFATHLLEDNVNIRVVQELMDHADVKTIEIYTHVMEKDISTTISPLDSM